MRGHLQVCALPDARHQELPALHAKSWFPVSILFTFVSIMRAPWWLDSVWGGMRTAATVMPLLADLPSSLLALCSGPADPHGLQYKRAHMVAHFSYHPPCMAL